MLFGTWTADKTFAAGDGRSTHKDYSGPRFARHLAAVREITELGNGIGLSCPQLCIAVLLDTPGVTACIVGARDAHQGALIASLGASVSAEQASAVWGIAARLEEDLTRL
jgi:aryl-alcohol dehydrogenase-like predicted oxidoreductase